MRFPATCTASNPHGKRHADKEEQRARQGDPTPHARARAAPPNCTSASLALPDPSLPSHRAHSRAPSRSSLVSVLFFSSEIARALAPSSPILLSAACTAPNPHDKRHAPTRGSHVPGNGTRRTRAAQLQARVSHCIVRAPARGRRPPWDRATSLPSQPPSTEPRTSEIEPCERPVLLERDRQSSRAVGADAIPCGVHSTRPTRQASRRQGGATRPATGPDAARARAPAQLHKRGSRQLHKRVSLCIVRPRAAAGRGPTPNPPSHRAQSCAHPRRSVLSVVFFSSKVARALAPTSPRRFPAACAAPNPNGKRHNSKGPRNRGKRTRRTAERARAHISMVPHVRLPSGPAQPGHPAVSDL